MRKQYILLSAIICSILLFCAAGVAAEEQTADAVQTAVIETPDVKIVIDGKTSVYTDVPLSVNQNTMLPLRELLANLGVPNDDEHILWDNDEKASRLLKTILRFICR